MFRASFFGMGDSEFFTLTSKCLVYLFIVLFWGCLLTPLSALDFHNENGTNSHYYIGYRGDSISVGQRFNLAVSSTFAIFTDFESQLDRFNGDSFSPKRINYSLGIRYKQIGWKHQCLHDIDTHRGIAYPKKDMFFIWGPKLNDIITKCIKITRIIAFIKCELLGHIVQLDVPFGPRYG